MTQTEEEGKVGRIEEIRSGRGFNLQFDLSNVFQSKVCEDPSAAWDFKLRETFTTYPV